MGERELELRVSRPHCAYCKDEVRIEEPKAACEACMSWAHAACVAEHGACPACGRAAQGALGAAPGPGAAARAGVAAGESAAAESPVLADSPELAHAKAILAATPSLTELARGADLTQAGLLARSPVGGSVAGRPRMRLLDWVLLVGVSGMAYCLAFALLLALCAFAERVGVEVETGGAVAFAALVSFFPLVLVAMGASEALQAAAIERQVRERRGADQE